MNIRLHISFPNSTNSVQNNPTRVLLKLFNLTVFDSNTNLKAIKIDKKDLPILRVFRVDKKKYSEIRLTCPENLEDTDYNLKVDEKAVVCPANQNNFTSLKINFNANRLQDVSFITPGFSSVEPQLDTDSNRQRLAPETTDGDEPSTFDGKDL